MIAIDGFVITDEMRDAGDQIASDLMDANLRSSMNGLGGSKNFDVSDFPNNTDLIVKYLDGELTSIEAIYISMERVK